MNRPCTCALGTDPNCPRDHAVEAEREQSAIDEAKAVLCRLRNFREIAEVEGDASLIEAMHLAQDDDDALLADRIRRAVWHRYADDLIAAKTQGIYSPVYAAHAIKREYQRDEAHKFHRPACTAPYGAAHPGSEPAGRPSLSPDGSVTPTSGAFSSTDRRYAA